MADMRSIGQMMADASRQTKAKIASPKIKRPPMCEGCGVNRSDPPSRLCPGCQAYQDHQR
jgi:hypothetical protein